MPSNVTEWMFWIFSTIIVGLIIGIGVNLITPRVKDTGEGWLQKRRLKHENYRKHLEGMSKRLDENPAEVFLFFVGNLSAYGMAFALAVGFGIAGVVVSLYLLQGSGDFGLVLSPLKYRIVMVIFIMTATAGLFLYVYSKILRTVRLANDLWSIYYKRKKDERKVEVENPQE